MIDTNEVTSAGIDLVPNGMTPGEKRHMVMLEKRIERGLQTFREVGAALQEIRDDRLYRETHANFESYCRERWAIDRNRAYQLIGAVEVVKVLGEGATGKLVNEAQARELTALVHENPEEARKVWAQVVASDEPVTAPRIRQVVRQHLQPIPEREVSTTARLMDAVGRLTEAFKRWQATSPSRAEKAQVSKAVTELISTLKARPG